MWCMNKSPIKDPLTSTCHVSSVRKKTQFERKMLFSETSHTAEIRFRFCHPMFFKTGYFMHLWCDECFVCWLLTISMYHYYKVMCNSGKKYYVNIWSNISSFKFIDLSVPNTISEILETISLPLPFLRKHIFRCSLLLLYFHLHFINN